MRRKLLGIVAALALMLLVVGGTLGWLDQQWHQPLALPDANVIITVEPGDSLSRILRRAEEDGWLTNGRVVGFIARQKGWDARIHVGEYALPPDLTAAELVARLVNGDIVQRAVTLPEGITLNAALKMLCNAEAMQCTLTGARDKALLALVAPCESAEGWFLPETYQYSRGDSDLDVLKRAHALMQSTLQQHWAERAIDVPLTDPYEALILASIIERETGVPRERPQIAGVFARRLRKGMRLQTDPTVIYGLGAEFEGNLTRRHLRDPDNPYNTYRIDGLPPTPIALPGRQALAAAVQPLPGDALYFVARGDGSHAFAATLEEHEANVRQYQLRRRSDYRSSPK